MSRNCDVVVVNIFEYNKGSSQSGCVKCKTYINASTSCIGCSEGFACTNLCSAYGYYLSSCLIHQLSSHGIRFSRNQIGISNSIYDSGVLYRSCLLRTACIVFCSGTNLWQINGLTLIVDILVGTDLQCTIVQGLINNSSCSIQGCCINGKFQCLCCGS